jgi:hypothetical protein
MSTIDIVVANKARYAVNDLTGALFIISPNIFTISTHPNKVLAPENLSFFSDIDDAQAHADAIVAEQAAVKSTTTHEQWQERIASSDSKKFIESTDAPALVRKSRATKAAPTETASA